MAGSEYSEQSLGFKLKHFYYRVIILFVSLVLTPAIIVATWDGFYLPIQMEAGIFFSLIMIWDALHTLKPYLGAKSIMEAGAKVALGDIRSAPEKLTKERTS